VVGESSSQKPGVARRQWLPEPPASTPPLPASALEDGPFPEPDEEVATLTLDPQTAVYVVGEPAPQGGRFIATWRRSLAIGEALPTMPLRRSLDGHILGALERNYRSAAADASLP